MKCKLVSEKFIQKRLPTRRRSSNKTDGGKLLAISGSKGMYGAGILTALAATRSGSGYTYLMMDWNHKQLLAHPDLLFVSFKMSEIKKISPTAIVYGPGIGQSNKVYRSFRYLRKNYKGPVVLDADGLKILSKLGPKKLPDNWILTPHAGELARLLKCSSNQIRNNPIASLVKAQNSFGCIVLLKGANTYITNCHTLFQIQKGTPALAKAGTGDVLAGIIGAMLAQGINPLESALIGAFAHGYASRFWIKKNDVLSLRPLDLIELIPKCLLAIRHAKLA